MFTIGDFARHGQVSVRMLRHYDMTGLLRPAWVDPASGYRFYEAAQLARLNRIVALKDLGFTLEQVAAMLDEQVSAEQLRGMLRLRQAELQSAIAADRLRLAQVEARLRIIEMEGTMPVEDIGVKRIPAVRVAELTAIAAGLEPAAIGPVIQPLYQDLGRRRARACHPAGQRRSRQRCWLRDQGSARGRPGGHDLAPRVHGQRPGNDPDPGPVDRCQRLPLRRIWPGAVPRMPRGPGPVGHRAAGANHAGMTCGRAPSPHGRGPAGEAAVTIAGRGRPGWRGAQLWLAAMPGRPNSGNRPASLNETILDSRAPPTVRTWIACARGTPSVPRR